MRRNVLGAAVGLASCLIAAVAALLLLPAMLVLLDRAHPGELGLRRMLAAAVTGVAIGVPVALLLGIPAVISHRLHANLWVGVGVATIAGGVLAHWLFLYISIVNGCGLHLSFPYSWLDACGR